MVNMWLDVTRVYIHYIHHVRTHSENERTISLKYPRKNHAITVHVEWRPERLSYSLIGDPVSKSEILEERIIVEKCCSDTGVATLTVAVGDEFIMGLVVR